MSTLSVHNLQGISTYSNKIEIPAGHKLSGAAGQFRLPNYPGNSKPSNPEIGDVILNSTTATLEVWTGDRWAVCGGGNRGGSSSNPALSGGDAYDQGNQTSGTVWVTIPGSGAFEFQYDATDRYGTGDLVGLNMMLHFLEQTILLSHTLYMVVQAQLFPLSIQTQLTALTTILLTKELIELEESNHMQEVTHFLQLDVLYRDSQKLSIKHLV